MDEITLRGAEGGPGERKRSEVELKRGGGEKERSWKRNICTPNTNQVGVGCLIQGPFVSGYSKILIRIVSSCGL